MKSIRPVFVIAMLMLLVFSGSFAEENLVSVKDFEATETTIYMNSIENSEPFILYFSPMKGKIPYVNVVSALNQLFGVNCYSGKKTSDGYMIQRSDNGASVFVNQAKKTLDFSDYDLFRKNKEAVTLLDIVSDDRYIVHEPLGFETRGVFFDILYETFLIDIAIDNNLCLIPLQTFSDIFASASFGTYLYNGRDVFYVQSRHELRGDDGVYTALGDKYYETQPAALDEKLASFNLRELGLNMMLNYGLKERHGIEKFSKWFDTMGLTERLSSTNSYDIDSALAEICAGYLGDLHSWFHLRSPYTRRDIEGTVKMISPSLKRVIQDQYEVQTVRKTFFPKGLPGVQKVGDTAYVTFDSFWISGRDYYMMPITKEERARVLEDYPSSGIDTLGLIHIANEMIQADKKIRNVVVDISCNRGGTLDAEIFVACWLLGCTDLKVKNALTGCKSSTSYTADVNFDKKVDGADTVKDRRIFGLVSNLSFSCGNLLASTLSESGKATLLGSKTGGGACAVYLTSSASGSLFQTSSFYQLCVEKNSAFFDIDDGVSPDYKLTEIQSFYNRSKNGLTGYIDKLY